MKKNYLLLAAVLQLSICYSQIKLKQVYTNKKSDAIGQFQGINFREGGFSGLYSIPGTEGKEFYTLSDRGVNVDAKNASGCKPTYDKIYAFPWYVPKIHRIRISSDSIQIMETITLKRPDGTGVSGIINPTGFGSTATEEAWRDTTSHCSDLSNVIVKKDIWGIDCEGIAIGRKNDFWVCEEGGSTIWNLDAGGKVIKRYSPYANLSGAEPLDMAIDTVFKYRKNNRGFEGVAVAPNGKVYALIQSPILYPNKTDGEKSNVHRLLEIDPTTGASRMFAYLNPGDLGTSPNKISSKDWKIGDLSAVNDSTFLVIEQGVGGNNAERKIYQIKINKATAIHSGLYGGKTVEQLKNAPGLQAQGIVPVAKTLFLDLRANGWPDSLDKAEGLAIINDSTIAVCNDNDFGQRSLTENGIAEATNIQSSIYLFGLEGNNKISGYITQNQTVKSHSEKTATFRRQISSASDDMEERLSPNTTLGETQTFTTGSIDYNSSDLELAFEAGKSNQNPQIIGLRFPQIDITNNRKVKKAYLRFEVDATDKNTGSCELFIYAENSDSAKTFNGTSNFTPFELTKRLKLNDSIQWNIPADSFKVVDKRYNSADISALVQKLIDRQGWKRNNAMAFYIKGKGTREVESFEGEGNAAPELVVEYYMTEEDSLLMVQRDSALTAATAKNPADYTVPGYTKLKMAIVTASKSLEEKSVLTLIQSLKDLKPKDMPYSIGMTFNGDPQSRMGFAWFTNENEKGGMVQIVAGKNKSHADFATPLKQITAKCDTMLNRNYCVSGNNLSALAGITNNTKKSYVRNKALATELTPNTTYSFRVGKPGAWSEIGTFTTAKQSKENFSFIYTTDPQANAVDMFDISQKTTHTAQRIYPNTNFWLSCGDLIETSGSTNSEWEYEQFFETQQDIFMHNPFVPVAGNHDKSKNKNFTYHFNTDSIGFDHTLSTTPGSVYSFVYGDALFMALSYEDYSVTGYLDALSTWMRAQVAAHPDTKWRIAFYHKTMYTGSGSHQSDADGKAVRDKMAPLFDELKIDLALQGHDHIYEVMGPIKNKNLVAGAITNQINVTFDARENVTGKWGGIFDVQDGTLYFLNNSAGKKKYEPRTQAQMQSAETALGLTNYFGMFTGRFGQTGRPTFSNINVSSDTIAIATYEVSDAGEASLFDSFKVIKTPKLPNGIAGANESNSINIYPTPVEEFVNIRFAKPVGANVEIIATDGVIKKSIRIEGDSQLSLSDLTKGVYLLKVNSANGNYVVKFVKK